MTNSSSLTMWEIGTTGVMVKVTTENSKDGNENNNKGSKVVEFVANPKHYLYGCCLAIFPLILFAILVGIIPSNTPRLPKSVGNSWNDSRGLMIILSFLVVMMVYGIIILVSCRRRLIITKDIVRIQSEYYICGMNIGKWLIPSCCIFKKTILTTNFNGLNHLETIEDDDGDQFSYIVCVTKDADKDYPLISSLSYHECEQVVKVFEEEFKYFRRDGGGDGDGDASTTDDSAV